jgi:alkanesulfonate monooxygenase SsuD/methylene tetrahydromethanopterin reductase-like flavin-dependent oxidoreductase (luciferase family)
MKQTKFGFCVPIFANPGMAFFRTPAYEKLDWVSIKETVLLCEKLGYDSLFVADHLFLGRDGDIWEGLSLMAALAAITEKMHVIPIHLCNNFRHPGLVAKAISTISHISKGRFELFYDYGWRKAEFDQYGIDFGQTDDERIQKMEEGLSVIKGLLENEKFSFKGKFYTLKDAICNPKPVKKVPVWMGEANNPEMVKAIVKHADMFNSMPCSVEGFKKKLDLLKQECGKQGRDMASLDLSLETQILIRETDAEIDEVFNNFEAIKGLNNSYDQDILTQLKMTNPALESFNSRADFEDEFMIGTPDQIKAKLDKFIELGVSHFMLWFMDYPDQKGINIFAEKVMAKYRRK